MIRLRLLFNGMLIYLFKKKAGELKDNIVSNTIYIVAITINIVAIAIHIVSNDFYIPKSAHHWLDILQHNCFSYKSICLAVCRQHSEVYYEA